MRHSDSTTACAHVQGGATGSASTDLVLLAVAAPPAVAAAAEWRQHLTLQLECLGQGTGLPSVVIKVEIHWEHQLC
jgi:hypothetical protein